MSAAIFDHLRREEAKFRSSTENNLSYNCKLCKESFEGKGLLLQHCRSVKHLQMEQLHILQLRAEGGANNPEIGDIFTVTSADTTEDMDTTGDKGRQSFLQSK